MTVWYHGGPESMVDSIVEGESFKTHDPLDMDEFAAIPGRVYIAKNRDYATAYSTTRGPVGGLLQVMVRDERLLWPDEDEVGFIFSEGYLRGELTDVEQSLFNRSISILPEIKKFMKEYKRELRGDRTVADLGKKVIKGLAKKDPDILYELAMICDRVSTPPGNIIVIKAWKIDSIGFGKSLDRSDAEFSDYSIPVNIQKPIYAHGIGRGWHHEPSRHALAARGVRTR